MRRKLRKTSRRAGAAVETAVVMPILIMMLLGITEFGYVYTVRQALETAAREGARVASLPGSTDEDIIERVERYLEPVEVQTEESYACEITHATVDDPTETVHISVAYSDVSLVGVGQFVLEDFNLGATCSMRKEGLD